MEVGIFSSDGELELMTCREVGKDLKNIVFGAKWHFLKCSRTMPVFWTHCAPMMIVTHLSKLDIVIKSQGYENYRRQYHTPVTGLGQEALLLLVAN